MRVPNVTNYRRKGLKFLSEIENGGNHAHPHGLHDCAYGCNRTRGLLFSRLAPAGRDHAAAEVVCAASPYFPATNSPTNDTAAGDGARLEMLVLRDDPTREYAYGPATGLP